MIVSQLLYASCEPASYASGYVLFLITEMWLPANFYKDVRKAT